MSSSAGVTSQVHGQSRGGSGASNRSGSGARGGGSGKKKVIELEYVYEPEMEGAR